MGHDVAFLALCRSLGLTTSEADTLWDEWYGDKLVYTQAMTPSEIAAEFDHAGQVYLNKEPGWTGP